jgi:hypothetical protein
MAALTINFSNDTKFLRDVDEYCEVYNFTGEDKIGFVERDLKRHLQEVSKANRLQKAREALTVEE